MVKIWEAYLTVRVIVGECETFPRKARKGKVTWTVETRDSLPPHTYNSQESERLRLHCIKLWLGRGGKRQPCSTQYHPYSRTISINNRQETVTVIKATSVCRKKSSVSSYQSIAKAANERTRSTPNHRRIFRSNKD